jgi:hypothetical protein
MLPAEVVPVSPVGPTTTTPAAIAAWSASADGSFMKFGKAVPPNGSTSTLTWSVMTSYWIVWMICAL